MIQNIQNMLYRQHFGSSSDEYNNVKITNKLNYPQGVSSLPKSERYNIPELMRYV